MKTLTDKSLAKVCGGAVILSTEALGSGGHGTHRSLNGEIGQRGIDASPVIFEV